MPKIITLDEKDFDHMLSKKELARLVHENVLHYHPDANEIPIADLYNRVGLETIGITNI